MLKEKGQTKVGLLAVFSVLTLSACGGGGSDSDKPTASELTPGVYHIGEVSTGEEGISLLSPTGEFVAAYVKNYTFGNMIFSASGEISGPATQYRELSTSWEITSGSLSGQVESSKEALLTGSSPSNPDEDRVESIFVRNDKSSDLGVTVPEISTSFMTVSGTSNIEIYPDGSFTGTDPVGCVLQGEIVIRDASINVFEVTYEASPCPDDPGNVRNGNFSGLGTYNHSEGELIFYARDERDKDVAWMFKGKRL